MTAKVQRIAHAREFEDPFRTLLSQRDDPPYAPLTLDTVEEL
jgi:hypothetical protein